MLVQSEVAQLAAARAGDHDAFGALTEPYRRALLVHCYRMLGSLQDAEDLVQETLLRAWQRLSSFEARSSLRAWLYAIATNSCLNALAQRRRRPISIQAAATPGVSWLAGPEEQWFDPFPDHLLTSVEPSPEAHYTLQESVSLAFLTALQRLPPRQRAILLLREVLTWRADEVASHLDMSVPTVNSLLHRARATLARLRNSGLIDSEVAVGGDAAIQPLLDHYVRAWETADIAGLLSLLTADATLAMPPAPESFSGRAAISAFVTEQLFGEQSPNFPGPASGRWRLLQTTANGLPAFGVYCADGAGGYQGIGVSLVVPQGAGIAAIVTFLRPELLLLFALPAAFDN